MRSCSNICKQASTILPSLFLMASCLLTDCLHAQDLLVTDSVVGFDKADAGVIYRYGQLTGYSFTYQFTKSSKHESISVTNLYDSNLNSTGKIVLQTNEKEQLLESLCLNNQLICILLNDKLQTVFTRIYNNAGSVIKEYARVLDDNSEYYFKKSRGATSTTGQKNQYVFALGENDFFTVIPLKNKTIFSYEVSIYRQGSSPVTYVPQEDTKQEKAEFIGATDDLLLFHVMSKKVLVNNKYDSWLLGIDFTTGTKRFMNSTLAGRYPYYPTNMVHRNNSSDFTILGSYFPTDSKIQKTRTSGICTIRCNSQGNELHTAYQSWEEEIGRYLSIVDTGGANDFGNLYVQKILPVKDDNYIIVGEGYKKKVNGTSTGLNILSAVMGITTGVMTGYSVYPVWGLDYTEFTLSDLAILHMDSAFAINKVHTFSKETHKTLTYGNDAVNKTKIEARRFLSDAFDYDFTQPGKDSTSFTVGYRQYSKVNKKEVFDYRIIENTNGKYLVHNIPLSSVANAVWGMPAKEGYTLIGEYFAKEQRLQLRLVKIE